MTEPLDPDPWLWYSQLVDTYHELAAVLAKLGRLANDPQYPEEAGLLARTINVGLAIVVSDVDRLVDDLSTHYEDR